MTDAHLDDERTIAFALGDLLADERRAAETHLEACAACGGAVERLVGLLAEERTLAGSSAPAYVLVKLLERQATARRGWTVFRRPVAALAAAVLAAAFFGVGFWQGRLASPLGRPTHTAESHPTRSTAPLPEPPVLPVEAAVAAGGDLALSSWNPQGAPHDARNLGARGDSL
jgi:hypothetical protein